MLSRNNCLACLFLVLAIIIVLYQWMYKEGFQNNEKSCLEQVEQINEKLETLENQGKRITEYIDKQQSE